MRPHYVRRTSGSAFTLIELMVVITIIAVLAGLIIMVVSLVRDRANSVKCMSNLRQMGMGFQAYAADNRGLVPPTQYSGGIWQTMAHAGIWFGFIETYLPPEGTAPLWHCPGSIFTLNEARAMGAKNMGKDDQVMTSYGHNERPWKARSIGEFNYRIAQIPNLSEVILLGDRWGTRDGVGVKTQGSIQAPYRCRPMTGSRSQPQPSVGLKWEEGSVRVSHSAGPGTDATRGRFNIVCLDGHVENIRWQDTFGPGGGLRIPNRWEANF